MYKVTYLLGAGASFHAIPVQNKLNKSILDFLARIKYEIKPFETNLLHSINTWQEIIELADKHASIDTLAKKLHITGKSDLLYKLKTILSAYFIYEQSYENIPSNAVQSFPQYSKEPIDPRYDFFMAATLNTEDQIPKLPDNLRIISWNYDSQLEMAFHPYSGIHFDDDKSLRENLRMFPYIGQTYTNDMDSDVDEIQIVKLNGTASSIYIKTKEGHEVISIRKLMYENCLTQIKTLIKSEHITFPEEEGAIHSSNINFAWELKENPFSAFAVDTANQIISDTDILVVIGYSFPVFNRDIDKLIFEDNTIEKVYIQDTVTNIQGVASRASRIMNLPLERFELDPNVDQFLIPFEL